MLKFDINVSGLDEAKKELEAQWLNAEHELAEQVKEDTVPFVPAKTESLSIRTRVEKSLIIYPGPYARFLYFGKLMVDPETGSAWARRGVKKVLTDKNLVFSQAVHPQAQSHWFEASKAQNIDKWEKKAKELIRNG